MKLEEIFRIQELWTSDVGQYGKYLFFILFDITLPAFDTVMRIDIIRVINMNRTFFQIKALAGRLHFNRRMN